MNEFIETTMIEEKKKTDRISECDKSNEFSRYCIVLS